MLSNLPWSPSRKRRDASEVDQVELASVEPGQSGRARRLLLGVLTLSLLALPTETGAIVRAVFVDAYLQVSVFVAATLAIFYVLERKLDIDTAGILARHARWQVPIASFLGALPGCGGAVVVVTQFVNGRISFGSLVAVLIATMGDAAFLLLSQRPLFGLTVFVVGFCVGTISGYVVDKIHGPSFLQEADRQQAKTRTAHLSPPLPASLGAAAPVTPRPITPFQHLWLWLLLPGLVLGILGAAQVDLAEVTGRPWVGNAVAALGLLGGVLSFVAWVQRGGMALHTETVACASGQARLSPLARVVADTSFVSAWVIFGFLIFELTLHFTQFDLAAFFGTAAPVVPLLAILIGLLPGCGPQVITTTLFLQGYIPTSALLGNAISNDGDALFPAIALAPRAAILATVYSTIPALIVAYTFYALFE